jgi:hypothetical protein
MKRLLFVLAVCSFVGATEASAAPQCPAGLHTRTPQEVLESHRQALAVGDVEFTVTCNYSEEAVVISDIGVDVGRAEIAESLQMLVFLFGGSVPQLHSEVTTVILNPVTHMVRTLFSVTTQCVDVPDGIDTYVIRNGQIVSQTAHGLPVFKCGPPPF